MGIWGDVLGGAELIGGGALSLMGDPMMGVPLMAGGIGTLGQQSTNAANAQQASNQMAFQQQSQQQSEAYNTQMSDTSWQRGVADMKAAGLNPALAYQQGGASAPTVQSMGGAMARMDNSAGAGISSAASAAQMAQSVAQADKTHAESDLIRANTQNVVADTAAGVDLKSAQSSAARTATGQDVGSYPIRQALLSQQLQNEGYSAREIQARTGSLDASSHMTDLQSQVLQPSADFAKTLWGHYVMPYLNSGSSAASSIGNMAGGLSKVPF